MTPINLAAAPVAWFQAHLWLWLILAAALTVAGLIVRYTPLVAAVHYRLERRITARADRDAYRTAQETAEGIKHQLADTTGSTGRARLLANLADAYAEMARLYPATHGPVPIASEPGRDMADALTLAGDTIGYLADAEDALAAGTGRVFTADRVAVFGWPALPAEAHRLLDAIATQSDLTRRVMLTADLADAIAPVIGQTAARMACNLPAPVVSTAGREG